MQLWYAMQARINGNLTAAVGYLNAFWNALNLVKNGATEATWPEILALDSQSQIQNANITDAIINQCLQDANKWGSFAGLFGWKGADAKATLANLQMQRTAALASSADLASRAKTAQASRVSSVAAGRISQDQADRAIENSNLDNILSSPWTILGVPAWAWAVGLGALFLLIGRR